jgi:hypothetical protein
MSNNKQSSVELFAIALYEGGYLQGNGDEINDLLERHKAMHKDEICTAFRIGDKFSVDYYLESELDTDEQYYNETFKNQSTN